ncbi:methionyl-tRNA formyltransferase [Candidatus Saccharibacteria bacterium]|nr:methionyl-tRNA formyltransferase [Candidatus Saccharibacteria bacterium]
MKMNEKISLVFFGSGPVAAESLRLLTNTFNIEAVVTKPTTEQEMSSACAYAPIFTVKNKMELDSLIENTEFNSQLAVLIDFGIIVNQKVIDYFPLGIINSHFSLLPELRGADPISFAILEGKDKTGVSLMLLVEAMDEGPILTFGEEVIEKTDTTPTLTGKLIKLSYSLLDHTIPKYLKGEIVPADQNYISEQFSRYVSYTRKLAKNDGVIDWNKTAEQINNEVRAFSGWPKSRTNLNGIDCVIIEVEPIKESFGNPGTIKVSGKDLAIQCGNKTALNIKIIKPAGKKEMTAEAFLAGYAQRLK